MLIHQCFWKITMQKNATHRNITPLATRTTMHKILSLMSYPLFNSEPHRVMSHTPEYFCAFAITNASSAHFV